jgi:hypothetical protein
MKKILLVGCLFAASWGFAHGQETVVPVDNVFVPSGFDTNDKTQIFLEGKFPNTCYRRPKTEVTPQNGVLHVSMKATRVPGPCIQAFVPFLEPVELGNLGIGAHRIVVDNGPSTVVSSIDVEVPGSSSIDNFTYANVTSVSARDKKIILTGYHPSSCMRLDRIDTKVSETGNTISIMPVIAQNPEQPICDCMIVPFEYEVPLPQMKSSMVLVHVRKIDGNALNYLVKNN